MKELSDQPPSVRTEGLQLLSVKLLLDIRDLLENPVLEQVAGGTRYLPYAPEKGDGKNGAEAAPSFMKRGHEA